MKSNFGHHSGSWLLMVVFLFILSNALFSQSDFKQSDFLPQREPISLLSLEKIKSKTLTISDAQLIIQATLEDAANNSNKEIIKINCDAVVSEIGQPIRTSGEFYSDVSEDAKVYPVKVTLKIRRYLMSKAVLNSGAYIYHLAVNKKGNWVAVKEIIIKETPMIDIFY